MNKLLWRFEDWIVRRYNFWANFLYYLDKGHWPRKAWDMAGNTLR